MEQLTKKQAVSLYESGEWKDWSDGEIVKVQLFQDFLCVPFDRFHEAIEKVLNRPVYTHEFGLNYKGIIAEYLGERPAPTFQEILDLVPKEKLIVLSV